MLSVLPSLDNLTVSKFGVCCYHGDLRVMFPISLVTTCLKHPGSTLPFLPELDDLTVSKFDVFLPW